MPRIDERTRVRRRLDDLTDPARAYGPREFTPGPDHPPRWDEDSADGPAVRRVPEPSESTTPTWLSEPHARTSSWHERWVPDRFRGSRWDPGPRGAVVLAVVAALAVVLAGIVALREKPVVHAVPPIAPAAATTSAPDLPARPRDASALTPDGHPAATGEVVVSVVGMVEFGGLRRFPPGARVADAVRAAVPHPDADLSGLNLAQQLSDGDQIVVGKSGPRPQQIGSTVVNAADSPATPPISGRPRPSGIPAAKVNLNTATEADLDTLPGVGPITARAILAWRTQHGKFTAIEQLTEIEGIGPARLARLREVVTI
ncbi:ComEA family DNA-binding protein [Nocardia crassostreae]|uniref:ComEA family DNA-binding protein n=1 Tax=Nocardia crassostreae TaxID=53428 RepID=UPI0012F8AED7|nr:ComEA family DNA-binding protein [Nocardia crassostreae]